MMQCYSCVCNTNEQHSLSRNECVCAAEHVRGTADDRRTMRVEAWDVSAQQPGCAVEMHCSTE